MPLSRFSRRLVLTLILSAALFLPVRSQNDLHFEHLTVKQGLSQGSVMCILQDSRGFMWLGTQDGLNRFDGYECKIYKHDPADPKTISDNFILFLAEDSAHTLWIGTLNNPDVLNRFDRTTETFTQVPRETVNLSGARVNQVHSEYVDPAGVRWYGGIGKGLSRFDPRTGRTKVYKHDPGDQSSLLDDKVYSVIGDHNGTLWIGTREGLDRFNPESGTFTHYRHDPKNPHSLSNNYVWPVLEDREGVLWVGSYLGGLNRFDRAAESFERFSHDDTDPGSLAGDQIYSLYEDASGMIWVGTGEHGVDRLHPELANFIHVLHHPSEPNSLADNNTLAMCVDHTGIVWVGTGKGLNRWDRKAGTFSLFAHDPANPRTIADNQCQTMLEARDGTLWLGMVSNGLDRFDRTTRTFTHFRNDPKDPTSLSENRIYALCEDRDGSLWVGTYGTGLCRFNPKTGTCKRYLHSDSIAASLGGQDVWALLQDREGTLWVGTYGNGLDRFNRESETFTHFAHNDSIPGSLSDNNVLSLCEDMAGDIWVGTTSGVNRLQRSSGTFRHYREKDGLANDVVFGILEDGNGNLWMSTNKGISRFDARQGKFRSYNYNDGLQGDEFNQASYAKDSRSGELFFGGPNGFNVFDPGKVRDNPYVPPIALSSFNRYNSDDKEGKPIEEPGIDSKRAITLSYKDNVANFNFAALSYYNTSKNEYAYKLEGFSDNWIKLGTDRRATFTNLDAGEYLLRVRGSNNDGIWNENGTVLRIVVTPPWWKTRWAYGLYAFLFVGLLYSLRRVEINRREQKAKIRESELHAKAVEAEKRALQAENDRQTKELEDARTLQLSMLPREVPKLPGYEISVFMKTATEVGGDYYDFNLTEDGILYIAFGDATGHGMQAGTIVTLMKGLFISDAPKTDIQEFFNHCSRAIKEIRLGRLYMAMTLAKIQGKSVSLSSAAMPPAYLIRKSDGSVEEILLKAIPLGAMKNFPYSLYQTEMETGDTLLFLTDGLPEQKNTDGEMFDYHRLIDSFKNSVDDGPRRIIENLVAEGDEWMNGQTQDDDITLLAIRKID